VDVATQLRRREGGVLPSLRDEFETLMHEWFERPFETETSAGAWCPRCDLEETDDAYVMHVELAGVEPDNIEVDFEDHTLTVKGERRFYQEKTEEGFTRRERSFGSFYRAVRLPDAVDADAIDATHDNGVLTVTIPKTAETRSHRVEVKTA
jgi:HSP20 family protein